MEAYSHLAAAVGQQACCSPPHHVVVISSHLPAAIDHKLGVDDQRDQAYVSHAKLQKKNED
jgi:hypothetical protein